MGCSDSRPLAAPAAGEEATSPAFAAPSKKPAPPHTYAPLLPATPAPAAPPPPPPYAVDSGRRGAAPRGAEPCPWCHQLPCAHPTAPPPPSPAAPAFLPPSPPACEAEEAAWSLTQAQAAALSRVAGRAARLHAAALPSLHRRGARLGLPPEDVDALLQFIAARAPLVVHCPAVALRAMLRDTHYRNQFETGTSCGTNCRSSREAWEAALFGNAYDGAPAFERVKYGCLNLTRSPTGVARALHYGEPFLVLRPAVRHRCTVASGDTGGGHGSCALGTATLCAHLLERLSDAELIAAAHVAAGRRSDAPSTLSTTYKELQIHGPVELRRHVLVLVLPASLRPAAAAGATLAASFAAAHGVPVVWGDEPEKLHALW